MRCVWGQWADSASEGRYMQRSAPALAMRTFFSSRSMTSGSYSALAATSARYMSRLRTASSSSCCLAARRSASPPACAACSLASAASAAAAAGSSRAAACAAASSSALMEASAFAGKLQKKTPTPILSVSTPAANGWWLVGWGFRVSGAGGHRRGGFASAVLAALCDEHLDVLEHGLADDAGLLALLRDLLLVVDGQLRLHERHERVLLLVRGHALARRHGGPHY